MFVYFSFFPANTFHQTSVPRHVLAGGYKRCVHPVCNFSLPVFPTARLPCSHARCIYSGCFLQTQGHFPNPVCCSRHSLMVFCPHQVKAKPCQAGGVQLPVWSSLSHQSGVRSAISQLPSKQPQLFSGVDTLLQTTLSLTFLMWKALGSEAARSQRTRV